MLSIFIWLFHFCHNSLFTIHKTNICRGQIRILPLKLIIDQFTIVWSVERRKKLRCTGDSESQEVCYLLTGVKAGIQSKFFQWGGGGRVREACFPGKSGDYVHWNRWKCSLNGQGWWKCLILVPTKRLIVKGSKLLGASYCRTSHHSYRLQNDRTT